MEATKPVKLWLYTLLFIFVQNAFGIVVTILFGLIFGFSGTHGGGASVIGIVVASHGMLWEFFKRHKRLMEKHEYRSIYRQTGIFYSVIVVIAMLILGASKDYLSDPAFWIISAIGIAVMWGMLWLGMWIGRWGLTRRLQRRNLI